ncbi:MAG: glycosyltransferase [Pseudomonadota bacterium]|nr:glycosyltransferase [Pseudomonadota bacterium]
MRIVFVASVSPSFEHARAAYIVLASLLDSMADAGHEVAYITIGSTNQTDVRTGKVLSEKGIRLLGEFSAGEYKTSDGIRFHERVKRLILQVFSGSPGYWIGPKLHKQLEIQRSLESFCPDAVILFWDSLFEAMLPYCGNSRVFGYLARPRFGAGVAVAENRQKSAGSIFGKLRAKLDRKVWEKEKTRHFARISSLDGVANICALDASMYNEEGINCTYIPNTWPDSFGRKWNEKRSDREATREKVSVLANVGNVNATGNSFGIAYLANELLPVISPELHEKMEINICGGGTLPDGVKLKLKRYRVNVKGFVTDIDEEFLSSRIFLLLNNAGPYTGGYTRVAYAFSSGCCLIAHKNLSVSMPEVAHGTTALLGESPQEIAECLEKAVNDLALVRRISSQARICYEDRFSPDKVAREIECMLKHNT